MQAGSAAGGSALAPPELPPTLRQPSPQTDLRQHLILQRPPQAGTHQVFHLHGGRDREEASWRRRERWQGRHHANSTPPRSRCPPLPLPAPLPPCPLLILQRTVVSAMFCSASVVRKAQCGVMRHCRGAEEGSAEQPDPLQCGCMRRCTALAQPPHDVAQLAPPVTCPPAACAPGPGGGRPSSSCAPWRVCVGGGGWGWGE